MIAISLSLISAPRTLCSSALRSVSLRQPSHLRVAYTSVQDSVRVDERFASARVYPSPHLVSTREVHAAYVEPVDM